MAIFSFLAKLGLDTSEFQLGVRKAQDSASGLGSTLNTKLTGGLKAAAAAAAGFFTVQAVKGFAHQVAETAGEIKDMSELLEISTDDVQRLQVAAQEANVPFTKVVAAFQRIEDMKASAAIGDEKAKGIFDILGIDPRKQSIEIIRSAVQASERGVKQNAAAFELFGNKVVFLKRVVSELNALPKIELISEKAINQIDRAEKATTNTLRRLWNWTVNKTGNALSTAEMVNNVSSAYADAYEQSKALGLDFKEGRRFRMNYVRDAIEKTQAAQMGVSVEEFRAKNAPKQETQEEALLRVAKASEATYELLSRNVAQ